MTRPSKRQRLQARVIKGGKGSKVAKQKLALMDALDRVAQLEKLLGISPTQKKHVDPFYNSNEWRTLRYEAIRLHKRKCQACGSVSSQIHVDHIKPRSKHPELELSLENLQILCVDCNLGKSNLFEDDWREQTLNNPSAE